MLSFEHWYANRDDYEIIIIEDIKNKEYKPEHKSLLKEIRHFKNKGIDIRLASNSKKTINPASHYNKGIRLSKGEYIIITNPECFHKSDILAGFDKYFEENTNYYIVCACESGVWSEGEWKGGAKINTFEDGMKFENKLWFQHTVYRDANLHFCSAMSKKNYMECGGFDDAYSDGYAVEDLDFLDNIYESKNLIPKAVDDLLVYHQPHTTIKPADWLQLNHHNKMVYFHKRGRMPNSPKPPPKDIS
jgi:hypothetical protein